MSPRDTVDISDLHQGLQEPIDDLKDLCIGSIGLFDLQEILKLVISVDARCSLGLEQRGGTGLGTGCIDLCPQSGGGDALGKVGSLFRHAAR